MLKQHIQEPQKKHRKKGDISTRSFRPAHSYPDLGIAARYLKSRAYDLIKEDDPDYFSCPDAQNADVIPLH